MATFKDLIRFFDAVERNVFSARSMTDLGNLTKDLIVKRTKSGGGISRRETPKGRFTTRLLPLSPAYKKRRRKTGVPGAFGTPGRSNLTYTGQLLDSFQVQGRFARFTVIIPNTRRKKPPTKKGQRFGDGNDDLTNSQVADQVEKNGRAFFGIKRDEGKILANEVENGVRRQVIRFIIT